MRHWTTSAAPKPLKRGLGHLMKDTGLQKEGLMLSLNRTRKETELRVGEGKRNSMESRNFWKKVGSTATWGEVTILTLPLFSV